ncbi:MAG: hypothetical protein ABJA75_01345 [Bradyrhizobium sp.]
MIHWRKNSKIQNALAQADAIGRSQAVIEFRLDGTIVAANQNFLNEFISSTAAAVEEQSIVTQDMSSNMQRASAELS